MASFRKGGGGSGFRPRGRGNFVSPDAHRINERITALKVRVIADDGEQLGVIPTSQALTIAEERGLDLVEVSPNADPPVCKLLDYGKFKYKEQKKEAEARKNRTETTIKELRIRYSTDSGDLETKLKKAREFILEGDKVKFSMRFKGREAMYVDLGVLKFKEIIERLADITTVDEQSPARGRQIYIVFAPVSKQATTAKPAAKGTEKAPAAKPVAVVGAAASESEPSVVTKIEIKTKSSAKEASSTVE